jgi:hypothetical protein
VIHLSVSRPFGDYKRGDLVVDKAEIDEILASHNQHDVVQVISHPEILHGHFFRTDEELRG